MLKGLLIFLVGLVVVLLGVSFLLPSDYHIERSVVVAAEPAVIYPSIVNLKTWPEWTAWTAEKDPNCKWTWSGAESGAGAMMSWVGEKHGSGEIKLVDAAAPKSVDYELSFEEGSMRSSGSFRLEPEGAGTKVVWTNEGELGSNPLYRYMGLLLDSWIGKDFEEGLANLKARAEAGKAPQ